MKDLLSELAQARYSAVSGAVDEAEKHIIEALELLDDALGRRLGPKPSARSIRGYLADARFFVQQGHLDRAVAALESAIEMLEPKRDSL